MRPENLTGFRSTLPNFESRYPVALTIAAVIVLLAVLPERIRLVPLWVAEVIGAAVLVPVVAVGLTHAKRLWLRVESIIVTTFFVLMAFGTLANLANLIDAMVHRAKEVSGLQLLGSSVAVWVTNVLMFSLLYWQLDRGGPEPRASGAGRSPDWLFPQESAPPHIVAAGWHPTFIDYLYLSYSTATAFSTTDVMPLTSRAKLLMMSESGISLMTIVIVAARAINILGS